MARKGVFLVCGTALLALAWRRGAHRFSPDCLPPLDPFWRKFFLFLFTAFGILYLANSMAPEISPDGSAYHLGLVARYVREHGFHRITTNMYANLSQGVEMLFVVAFSIGRHSAAAMVHFAFLLALPLLIVAYGLRSGFPVAAVCAALFVYISPVVGIDGISGYIDVAVACVAFALFYLLQIWAAERDPGLVVPIGLLAGFGYASKYTAVLAVPYALGFLAWKQQRKRAPLLRPVLVAGLCAGAVMLPWIAKNWIWLGNPFSPFLNAVFPNPYVTVGFEHEYSQMMRIYTLHSRWEIPLQVTVRGALSGLLGPLFLLAPVALAALRRRTGRQVLLGALVFGLPYLGNIGTRFLIPPLPFLAVAIAMELAAVKYLAPPGGHACGSFLAFGNPPLCPARLVAPAQSALARGLAHQAGRALSGCKPAQLCHRPADRAGCAFGRQGSDLYSDTRSLHHAPDSGGLRVGCQPHRRGHSVDAPDSGSYPDVAAAVPIPHTEVAAHPGGPNRFLRERLECRRVAGVRRRA